jgi:hypothetical protein
MGGQRLLAEYFFGRLWVDYLTSEVILAFVPREAIDSYCELQEGSIVRESVFRVLFCLYPFFAMTLAFDFFMRSLRNASLPYMIPGISSTINSA